jgi:hypothetical protein
MLQINGKQVHMLYINFITSSVIKKGEHIEPNSLLPLSRLKRHEMAVTSETRRHVAGPGFPLPVSGVEMSQVESINPPSPVPLWRGRMHSARIFKQSIGVGIE